MSLPSLRFPGLLRFYEHSESWCSALRPSEGMNSVCCATTISLLISSTLPSILSPTTRVRDVWLFLIVRVFPSAITPWRLTQIPFRIRSFFRTQNLAHHFIHSSADSRRPEPNRVHARITPAIHFVTDWMFTSSCSPRSHLYAAVTFSHRQMNFHRTGTFTLLC